MLKIISVCAGRRSTTGDNSERSECVPAEFRRRLQTDYEWISNDQVKIVRNDLI